MALSAWDKTRVYGTWYTHDGNRIPGEYKVTVPARITVEAGEAIVPAGVYAEGDLNTSNPSNPALDIMVPANDDPDITPLGWQIQVVVTLQTPGGRVTETYVIDTPYDGEVNLRTIPLAQRIPATQTMLIRGVAGGVAALDPDGDVIDADGNKVTGGEGGGAVASVNGQTGEVVLNAGHVGARPDDWQPDLSAYTPTSGLAAVATSGSYDDLDDKPTIPPALDPQDFATAAQGALADTAVQPAAIADFITAAEIPAAPTWDTITGKPAVVAAGTSQTAARDAIGAGTSNLQLGTGPTTAKAGDYTPTVADVPNLPASKINSGTLNQARIPALPYRADSWTPDVTDLPSGATVTVRYSGTTWPARPAGGTDITVQWVDYTGGAPTPPNAIEDHDLVIIPAGA